MAHNQPQEKAWVPRQHKVGRFGTMSRGTHGKAKLMAQMIAEEGEEAAAMADREVGSTYLEVAFIKTKDGRDGKAVEKLFASMASGGPEAYYKFFVVEAGDGIRPSSHIMIGVGSSDSYIQQWKGMDQDLAMQLKSLMKSYKSYIFTTDATEPLKQQVESTNQSSKVYGIDLVEAPAYAIPDGRPGIAKFVASVGKSFVVRIEETSFANEADMQGYEKAMGLLFASPHRQTSSPKYRLSGEAPGQHSEPVKMPAGQLAACARGHGMSYFHTTKQPICAPPPSRLTTPIAFTMQKTEKDFFMVVFDEVETITDDGDVEADNQEIAVEKAKITAANYYFCGPATTSVTLKHEQVTAQKKGYFAKLAGPVF